MTLTEVHDEPSRFLTVAPSLSAICEAGHFRVLKKWCDELKPIYGQRYEVLFSIERAACPLLGVITYGIQMTAVTRDKNHELKVWVQRRAITKSTYDRILASLGTGLNTPWPAVPLS